MKMNQGPRIKQEQITRDVDQTGVSKWPQKSSLPLIKTWEEVAVCWLTLGRTRKFITPPWYKGGGGGWMEPLPGVFDMLQYFETILPLVVSLWSS